VKTLVVLGLAVMLAVAVVAFVVGLVLVGYAALGTGGLWLAVTASDTPPDQQGPGNREHSCGGRRG